MTLDEGILRDAKETDILEIDVLVVGAGLFGSVIGDALKNMGHDVTYIDAFRKEAGSRPAACLMRPSWLSSMGKDKYEPSLRLLDELYGLEDVSFKTKPLNKSVTVHWVNPEKIMNWDKAIKGIVVEVFERENKAIAKIAINNKYYFVKPSILIIATGVWSKRLIHIPDLVGLAGAAFTWPGLTYENIISLWAPYKQLVVFNNWKPNTLWVGDGSAIKPQNWTMDRQQESLARCSKIINRSMVDANVMYGVRPYIKGVKSCYLQKLWDNTWVATAGAKNGTAAAGWAAWEITQQC